jgi:hypothetical protein
MTKVVQIITHKCVYQQLSITAIERPYRLQQTSSKVDLEQHISASDQAYNIGVSQYQPKVLLHDLIE